jgi:hypothetical protein
MHHARSRVSVCAAFPCVVYSKRLSKEERGPPLQSQWQIKVAFVGRGQNSCLKLLLCPHSLPCVLKPPCPGHSGLSAWDTGVCTVSRPNSKVTSKGR